jgi:hypothetical protein
MDRHRGDQGRGMGSYGGGGYGGEACKVLKLLQQS